MLRPNFEVYACFQHPRRTLARPDPGRDKHHVECSGAATSVQLIVLGFVPYAWLNVDQDRVG